MDLISKFLIAIAIMIVGIALSSVIVMYLWNWLMPDIFGLPEVTWLQAFGLALLSQVLIKGVSTNTSSD